MCGPFWLKLGLATTGPARLALAPLKCADWVTLLVCKTASPPPVDRGAGKKSGYRSYHRRKAGSTEWVEIDEEDTDALPLFVLQGDFPQPPILVTMTLEGSPAQFELNTGAVVTVMPEEKFCQLFADQPMKQTSVELKRDRHRRAAGDSG